MNTKSAIQLVCETLEARNQFRNNLIELTEKYDVQNNVFACERNGELQELTEGYFGEVSTFYSLDEALEECNIFTQGIWIHNGKYTVGNLYRNLSDVKEENVLDLYNSQLL